MFKNLMMYRLATPLQVSSLELESLLQSGRFEECLASQEKSFGWIAPRGEDHAPLLEVIDSQWLLKLQFELKVIPASVVKRAAQTQVDEIEKQSGRKPGRKEVRDIHETVRQTLLPMAFTKQSSVLVWIDRVAGLIMLDAGSQGKADEAITALMKVLDGLKVQQLQTQISPASAMAQWLAMQQAPAGFSIDRECELKAADESKSVVRYSRHPLDTDEVCQHIAMGKMPTRLAITWGDRISMVLTETLQLKKVTLLDLVLDEAPNLQTDGREDNFDADIVIMTSELRNFIPALVDALGGEMSLISV